MATDPTQDPNQNPESVKTGETTNSDNSEKVVPAYRLMEEATKRRTAEAKLAEYEKKEQEKADADKSWQEKHTTLKTEFETFKKTVVREKLVDKATSKLKEAGFSEKLIKVGLPQDLTEDTLDEAVKNFTKEFKEFLPTKTEEAAPTNPALPATASQHPSTPQAVPAYKLDQSELMSRALKSLDKGN